MFARRTARPPRARPARTTRSRAPTSTASSTDSRSSPELPLPPPSPLPLLSLYAARRTYSHCAGLIASRNLSLAVLSPSVYHSRSTVSFRSVSAHYSPLPVLLAFVCGYWISRSHCFGKDGSPFLSSLLFFFSIAPRVPYRSFRDGVFFYVYFMRPAPRPFFFHCLRLRTSFGPGPAAAPPLSFIVGLVVPRRRSCSLLPLPASIPIIALPNIPTLPRLVLPVPFSSAPARPLSPLVPYIHVHAAA